MWRCQPQCLGQPQCQNNLICANATCNPVYGFLEAKPLVLDVNSWYVLTTQNTMDTTMTNTML